MTETQRDAITSAATGLMIYQTDGTIGFYYYNGSRWSQVSANMNTYSIGDVVNGGVVFWLDSTGQHGLVVAMADAATNVKWGCSTDLPNLSNIPYNNGVPVGLGAEIGDGFNNTNDIIRDSIIFNCSTSPDAAHAARYVGLEWFLPSAKELNQIYINKTTLEGVSGFTGFSDYYWSSTENGWGWAWAQSFQDGTQDEDSKDNIYSVRAVRSF